MSFPISKSITRSVDWGKADLIGQPLAVSHENPRKLPG
jgi:hypothetical protein